MRITPNLIDATTTALNALFAFKYPADAVLSKYFRDNRALGQNDRGFIAETAYAVLRRRRLLEHLLGADVTRRRLVLAALTRLSGVSQRQLEGVVSEKELKWVADLKGRQASELTLGEQADFPDWLTDRLLNHMTPQDLLALAQGLNQSAPLDLRVNPLKAEREAVLARFAEEGIAAEAGKLSPLCIRLKAKPALQKHPLYLDGTIEVQDEGSQLLGYLLAPKRGEMVADFCAGAGGKTLLLGALMRSTGRLYAFDVSDKRLAGKIDRVLVDAPCSGLGTLRRNPDLKWRQTPEGVAELARKQHDILKGASRLVKKGGRLAYATCSILPEENEAIVAAFLAENADFRQVPAQEILEKQGIALACGETLRLAPHTHGTDGFFAAVLERNP